MSLAIKPGDVLDGKYVVERLLGQGGMGAVFVAHEEQLGRRVAIKILLPEVIGSQEAIARFEREARAAASLESDHVTRVLNVGRLDGGLPYIVMEFLEGEDLANILAKRGPLPVGEVIAIMMHACDALAEAHSRGIVHRDLKPANLFFARRSNGSAIVKVLDFGISKATAASPLGGGLTATRALMGTPYYMSPEQLREARNVDGKADIWALGITMYELLVGGPPFVAEGLAELCVQVLTTPHAPISFRRADVPVQLSAIVDRCLEKDPAKRFASAEELAGALHALSDKFPDQSGGLRPLAYRPTPAPARDPAQFGGGVAPTVGHTPYELDVPRHGASGPPGPAPMPASAQSVDGGLTRAPFVPATSDGIAHTRAPLPTTHSAGAAAAVIIGAAMLLVGGAGAVLFTMSGRSKATNAAADPPASAAPVASAASSAHGPPGEPIIPLQAVAQTRPGTDAHPTGDAGVQAAHPVASATGSAHAPTGPTGSSAAASSHGALPPTTKTAPVSTGTMPPGPPPIPLDRR